ncbi:hypothetical protein STTU_p0118 (plasmid) [Streptomyces sp. Tu6071]|nr:hypothetical protein STTU_p0118 [Streptomyces sp. Tu6071]
MGGRGTAAVAVAVRAGDARGVVQAGALLGGGTRRATTGGDTGVGLAGLGEHPVLERRGGALRVGAGGLGRRLRLTAPGLVRLRAGRERVALDARRAGQGSVRHANSIS